ncbi:MAG TPA: zinc-ribbon domain-containing protein [Terriglobia bacterium]|nr:zinc-ribbon domain-containing protein [Terriglobia bacterium]
MAFCAKCGASLNEGAAYCGACGSAVGTARATGRGTRVEFRQPTGGTSFEKPIPSNGAAALAYLVGFITGIIFLVIEPYKRDSYVRFHAFQSIFLSVAYVAAFMIWGVISGTLFVVSLGFLWSVLLLLWALLRLAFFLLWLFMMYKAYNNERFMLPFIGPLAAKQAG